jgi:hypothetical protein
MEGNRQERRERRRRGRKRGRGRVQSGNHVLAVLSWQSVLAFLICMPSPSCPVVLVLFGLFCSGFPFLAVMSRLSCVLLSMSCPSNTVLTVLFCVSCLLALSWMFCSACPVLAEKFWLSYLAVLFGPSILLSSTFVLPLLSYFKSPVLAVLFW